MKHASLPMGAVEIGTIAEAETDDEEDEEIIEGKNIKDKNKIIKTSFKIQEIQEFKEESINLNQEKM